MPYAKKIVLNCTKGYRSRLDELVEDLIRDGVIYVGVVGYNCATAEDEIDWIVLGEDGKRDYSLLTASHPDESIAKAVEFAKSLTGEFAGEVQIVDL